MAQSFLAGSHQSLPGNPQKGLEPARDCAFFHKGLSEGSQPAVRITREDDRIYSIIHPKKGCLEIKKGLNCKY